MSGTEYHKILSPFNRYTDGPNRNKFCFGDWTRPEFGVLANQNWVWTEKIDGTNIRVMWDGHKPRFGGRTDNANMPVALLDVLQGLFTEELMEQTFGDSEAVLYGEGYGAKISRGGGNYSATPAFALFDVKVGKWWLEHGNVKAVAEDLGINCVPLIMAGSVGEAIEKVGGGLKSTFGDFWAEGLVGRAPCGMLTRSGERIIMKVKHVDLFESEGMAASASQR